MNNKVEDRLILLSLGELPEEEAAEVEAEIRKNPKARKELEAYRFIAAQLETLRTEGLEPCPEAPLEKEMLRRNRRTSRTQWAIAAAALLLCAVCAAYFAPRSAYENFLLTKSFCPDAHKMTASPNSVACYQKKSVNDYSPHSSSQNSSMDSNCPIFCAQESRMDDGSSNYNARSQGKEMALLNEKNDKIFRMEKAEEIGGRDELETASETGDVDANHPYSIAVNSADGYTGQQENPFFNVRTEPFSTFGVDVDTASYTIMRQNLTESEQKPAPDSVRVEEYVNYFDYDLPEPAPSDDCPFAATAEIGPHPWAPGLLLAKIGIQGRRIKTADLPPLNLVFLIDVSGSMDYRNKLPLVTDALLKLVDTLRPQDRVAIVTYSCSTRVVLDSTALEESRVNRKKIESAILGLKTGGSTNGSGGIELAYQTARQNFDKGAINRVILCSDGDFNVGATGFSALESIIQDEAKSGVFLTVLGFGMGNYKDNRMELLADKGNGNYAYIDSRDEARRILCDEIGSTLVTIAKDVKIQIDFNPATIDSYRLLGYENRLLAAEDFNDDRKDSGDIGAGHRVVALYEILPKGVANPYRGKIDPSRYAAAPDAGAGAEPNQSAGSNQSADAGPNQIEGSDQSGAANAKKEAKPFVNELFLVKIRYKKPDGDVSTYRDFPVEKPSAEELTRVERSIDFRFAASVALFAQIFRNSQYTNGASFGTVQELLNGTIGDDPKRLEFQSLVKQAKELPQNTQTLREPSRQDSEKREEFPADTNVPALPE